MTPADRGKALLTGRFLRASASLDWLSIGFTVVAASALAFGDPAHRVSATAAMTFGIVARVYGLRIAFDAGLFEDIANGLLEQEDLDSALIGLGFMAKQKTERPWEERCRGARRLVTLHGLVTLVQAAALVWMSFAGGNP